MKPKGGGKKPEGPHIPVVYADPDPGRTKPIGDPDGGAKEPTDDPDGFPY